MGGKIKNAQNHRRIDARGEAELCVHSIKPVIYGILYFLPRSVYTHSNFVGASNLL